MKQLTIRVIKLFLIYILAITAPTLGVMIYDTFVSSDRRCPPTRVVPHHHAPGESRI